MLKLATLDDVGAVVLMALRFHKNSTYQGIPADIEKTTAVAEHLIKDDDSLVVLAYVEDVLVGMLAGTLSQMVFSYEKMASEVLWWVEPEFRNSRHSLELIQAYEYWAKLKGATFCQMSLLNDATSERVERFYQRKGYRKTEMAYLKEI